MGFLSVTLTFLGYVLVYASLAGPPGKPGLFATSPWAGVLADAYDAGSAPDDGTGGQQ